MRKMRVLFLLAAIVLTGVSPRADSQPPTTSKPDRTKMGPLPAAEAGRPDKAKKREREFKRMLTHATLKGTWQMTGEEGLAGKAPLSEPKPDTYTIDKVSKANDDYWVITARIQYADKDVFIPVTVRVVWAEDTPIITLDTMALPGLGTYSARVMIYRGFYSGTWFGKNYGGVLSGRIIHEDRSKPGATTKPAQ